MSPLAPRRLRFVKLLLAAGIAATVLHFADNAFFIAHYPEPAWITPLGVIQTWCVVTALALFALSRKTADAPFFWASGVYSVILLGGLLHYRFAAPMDMPMRSNLTVITEGAVGIALAATLIATGIARRRRRAEVREGEQP